MPVTAPGIPETLLIDSRGGVYRHNVVTNETTLIRDYSLSWTDIAVTPNGGVYAVTNSGLYQLNLERGTSTLLRSLSDSPNGLASDGDGNLYIGYAFSSQIDIARTNGSVFDTIGLPDNTSSAGDIHIIGQTLYYTTVFQELLTINLNTGNIVRIVDHDIRAAYGLHHNDGELFILAGDDVYTVNPDTGATAVAYEIGGEFTGSVFGAATSTSPTINGTQSNDVLIARFGDLRLFGGEGNDTLAGSIGADDLNGNQGNDVLYSGFGNDRISGGFGRDSMYGGAGNDTLLGNAGNDLLGGGDGNDRLEGGDGDDSMWTSVGNDYAYGSSGNDTIGGAQGNDSLAGGAGNDELWGSIGNDVLFGGSGNDAIGAGSGDDSIRGGSGNDAIFGGAGNDTAFGGDGNDTIFGFKGDDYIRGGAGDDLIFGGAGADTFVFGLAGGDDRIFSSLNEDSLRLDDLLRLDDALWAGNLTEVQVLSKFGSTSGSSYVLEFAQGDSIILEGAGPATQAELLEFIEIF